jgi:glutathione S-transferase
MADELVFYTHPMSRGRIVRWVLEELGRPYRTELLDFGTTMKAPGYLAINPMGKVPTIRHGDTVVTECGAICAYLADAFPEAGLAPPPGDRLRGPYYRWMFFAAGPIEAAVTDRALGVEVPQERRGTVGYGSFAEVIAALESAVSGRDYLVGDRFTAADVYVGSQIGWGMRFGSIEKRPAFERYWERNRLAAGRPAGAGDRQRSHAGSAPSPSLAGPPAVAARADVDRRSALRKRDAQMMAWIAFDRAVKFVERLGLQLRQLEWPRNLHGSHASFA